MLNLCWKQPNNCRNHSLFLNSSLLFPAGIAGCTAENIIISPQRLGDFRNQVIAWRPLRILFRDGRCRTAIIRDNERVGPSAELQDGASFKRLWLITAWQVAGPFELTPPPIQKSKTCGKSGLSMFFLDRRAAWVAYLAFSVIGSYWCSYLQRGWDSWWLDPKMSDLVLIVSCFDSAFKNLNLWRISLLPRCPFASPRARQRLIVHVTLWATEHSFNIPWFSVVRRSCDWGVYYW